MKYLHKVMLMAATLLSAPLALSLPSAAHAQDSDELSRPIAVRAVRTLKFDRSIGRIEIDREGIVSVRAPTPRSLVITGTRPGNALLSVYADGGGLLATGQLSVVSASDRAESGFGPGSGQARGLIDPTSEQMVAVDLQFAAVSTNTLKALGFNFSKLSGDIQGAIVSPSSLASFAFAPTGLAVSASAPLQNAFNLFLAGPNRGIGAVLSALSSSGLSQMLAEPTLLVRSGEEAHFLAGGEIPIPVPQNGGGNGSTISIQFKEFGVRLSVAPFVLSNDRIVLKIAPEVSELDYNNGVRLQGYNVPGIRRRSAETTVQLASGQSFIIAGLNYTNSTVSKEKLPLLGDLPILGAFFKRQQNQKERQELIIVATPRLVGPMEPGTLPPLPGLADGAPDPTIGDMILGTDGIEQRSRPFGVVRR